MTQMVPGPGRPVPVHPADNDQQHIQEVLTWLGSSDYAALGKPNQQAFLQHLALHAQQAQVKQQQMAMAAQQQQMQGPQQQAPQQGPALGQERIEPQLRGKGNMGAMGSPEAASMASANGNGNGFQPPGALPPRGGF
jgi:hypothetical protein